jgi:hypothetical protein
VATYGKLCNNKTFSNVTAKTPKSCEKVKATPKYNPGALQVEFNINDDGCKKGGPPQLLCDLEFLKTLNRSLFS